MCSFKVTEMREKTKKVQVGREEEEETGGEGFRLQWGVPVEYRELRRGQDKEGALGRRLL